RTLHCRPSVISLLPYTALSFGHPPLIGAIELGARNREEVLHWHSARADGHVGILNPVHMAAYLRAGRDTEVVLVQRIVVAAEASELPPRFTRNELIESLDAVDS